MAGEERRADSRCGPGIGQRCHPRGERLAGRCCACEAMTYPDLSEDRAARRARKRAGAIQVEFAEINGTLPTQEGPVNYSTGDALLTDIDGQRRPIARDTFDINYAPMAPIRPGKA